MPTAISRSTLTKMVRLSLTVSTTLSAKPKSGSLKDDFTHWFSTKPFDNETGLVQYELRLYSSAFGSFLSRDAVGVNGGYNEYGVLNNNLVNDIDILGMMPCKIQISYKGMNGQTKEVGSEGSSEQDIRPIFDNKELWGHQDLSKPDVVIKNGCAIIKISVRVHLHPSLKSAKYKPQPGDIYVLTTHMGSGKWREGGSDVLRSGRSVGDMVLYPYILAHEQGHAKHIFMHIQTLKNLINNKAVQWSETTPIQRVKLDILNAHDVFFKRYVEESGKDADAAELMMIQSEKGWVRKDGEIWKEFVPKGTTHLWYYFKK
jgi:RHS repeat-associated protein